MNPERWKQVDALFQAAVSMPEQEREIYLADACGGDEALRREIESMLAAQSSARDFFAAPSQASQQASQPTSHSMAAKPETVFDSSLPTSPPSEPSAEQISADEEPVRRHWNEKWFFRCALAGIILVAVLHFLMGWVTYKYARLERIGYLADMRGTALIIVWVDPRGPAAGKLRAGDEILAINNDRKFGRMMGIVVIRQTPDQPARYVVRRDGAEVTVDLDTGFYPTEGFSIRWQRFLYGFPRGMVFLAIALLILLMKRQDRFAQIGILAFIFLGAFNLRLLLFALMEQLTGWEIWLEFAILFLHGGLNFIPFAFHMAALFPPGAGPPLTWFWTWLRRSFYVLSAVLCVLAWLTLLMPYSETITAFLFSNEYLWIHLPRMTRNWYYAIGLICICAMLIRNFVIIRDVNHRRRMKLIIYGNLLTILPVALLSLTDQLIRLIYGTSRTWIEFYESMLWITNSTTIWIPMVWGYAILTQRVYPARVVLRRSLQYLFARNALRVLLGLPLLALLIHIFSQPDQSIRQLFFTQPAAFVLMALAALSLTFRNQLRGWLDRKFFREQVSQEQILFHLIDEVQDFESLPELCRGVSRRLEEALHPARSYFLFRRDRAEEQTSGNQPLVFSSRSEALMISPAEEVAMLELMKRQNTALQLPLPRGLRLSAEEKLFLERLGVSLLVPMRDSENQLIGVLLLGEKKSEEPYSPTDRRLLLAVAQQMATTIEVGQLRAQVRRKTQNERQVLARLDAAHINLLRECPQCGLCFDSTQNHCSDCRTELTLSLPVERTIDERYRLERLLGKGGMGAVYAATDLRLRRAVAVKLIHADYFGDKKLLRRFEQEAQTAARLNHPNIVKVFDYGRTQTGGAASSGAWLVMELVNGATMRDELNRLGSLSPELAADWFAQLLDGLNAAHQASIIHRDLKPENILVSRNAQGREQLQILDFGLAKLREASTQTDDNKGLTTLTRPGMIVGTLFYMSPEQLSGEVLGETSDIFTIGVMLAEALTGRRPFDGKTPAAVLEAIWKQPFRLSGENEALTNLNRVIQRCLMINPRHRFQTVTELKTELIPALLACAGTTNLEARPVATHPSALPTQGYSHKDFKTGDQGE